MDLEPLTAADVVAGAQAATRIIPSIKALFPAAWAVGPAATCACAPADNLALHQALATAAGGDVLVCDAGGALDGGYLGELMAIDAIRRGIAGLVIWGSVRDTRQLEALGFPVFCIGTSIPSCQKARVRSLGAPVMLDGVYVEPGDQIVADGDGVVVVPRASWQSARAAGLSVQRHEAEIVDRLEQGSTLAGLLSLEIPGSPEAPAATAPTATV